MGEYLGELAENDQNGGHNTAPFPGNILKALGIPIWGDEQIVLYTVLVRHLVIARWALAHSHTLLASL